MFDHCIKIIENILIFLMKLVEFLKQENKELRNTIKEQNKEILNLNEDIHFIDMTTIIKKMKEV